MLPRVQTQQRLEVDAAGRELAGPVAGAEDLVAEGLVGGAVLPDGVHVGALETPVGAGVRAAGEVGGQDAVVAGTRADEPDEARAEHGGGGDDELAAEGLDGGEAGLELLAQDVGHGRARGRDAVEEEVGVVCHGGPVEDGGLAGFSSGHEGDCLGVLVLELGACDRGYVRLCDALSNSFGGFLGMKRTGCQGIELLRHQGHVVGPGNGEAGRGHEVGHALVGVVVSELGDIVQTPRRCEGGLRCP